MLNDMIVTIRSNSGFYEAVEVEEIKKDWVKYFDCLKRRYDFKIEKNEVSYDSDHVFPKCFYAPTIKSLTEVINHY